ncbi:MAG: hypothetical protein UY27_C0007G0005 [Candidatus Gottesmanbacteria bacterium GW2011_GWA1_48_13]|nr:MAG: hypothetical protein UY27_C0007G0005 [Candidatus Gottesmanbacteria bacterium GW2011_GWA1_48_13]
MPVELYLTRHAMPGEKNIIANTFAFGGDNVIGRESDSEKRSIGMCVYLGDGVFVTNKHVITGLEMNYLEENIQCPNVIYDLYGEEKHIDPKMIYVGQNRFAHAKEDFVLFRVDPDAHPWIGNLPHYDIDESEQRPQKGRSTAVGIPQLLYVKGFNAGREPLSFENVGRQAVVRFAEDIPKWQQRDTFLIPYENKKNGLWSFKVKLTPGYSGGPFIHDGVLYGINVSTSKDPREAQSSAIGIGFILSKLREAMVYAKYDKIEAGI